MAQGTIKKIVQEKGFGFIATADDEGEDVFFHQSSIADGGFAGLARGQRVEYELADARKGDKGPRAKSVKPV